MADPNSRKFWTKTKIIVAVVVLVAAGLTARYFFKGPPPVSYVSVPVARGALTVTVTTTGTLQPKSQVDIGAEVSGKIDQVLVDYNDHVKAGQLLAVINTDQVKAQLAQSQATLATNQATVKETKAKRDRFRRSTC